jgi:predicted acylesterase/phospholipase RssA
VLTIQTAPRPRRTGRIGIALAGGGPLGAFYELGALQALAECIQGFAPCDLYGYAGVSSGSMLAAGLANGLTPVDIGRLTVSNDAGLDTAHPGLFLQPAFGEYARRLALLPGIALRALAQYARAPLSQGIAEALAPLAAAMPAGFLDSAPFERYLRRLYGSGGRTNDFRELGRRQRRNSPPPRTRRRSNSVTTSPPPASAIRSSANPVVPRALTTLERWSPTRREPAKT